MMDMDQYAYTSRLRTKDPVEKLFFALTMITTCLLANYVPVSILILGIMAVMIVGINKTPFKVLMKLLTVPLGFLIIGVLTIAFSVTQTNTGLIVAIPVFDHYIGASQTGIQQAVSLLLKSLSCISSLYFLSLSTPFMDLISALKKIHCPLLLLELMHLIYKMIFVLLETANTMAVAQDSRLGYSSLKSSYRSFSALASTLLVRSFKRADALYTALEARGSDGTLNVLEEQFPKSLNSYLMTMAMGLSLMLISLCFKG